MSTFQTLMGFMGFGQQEYILKNWISNCRVTTNIYMEKGRKRNLDLARNFCE